MMMGGSLVNEEIRESLFWSHSTLTRGRGGGGCHLCSLRPHPAVARPPPPGVAAQHSPPGPRVSGGRAPRVLPVSGSVSVLSTWCRRAHTTLTSLSASQVTSTDSITTLPSVISSLAARTLSGE